MFSGTNSVGDVFRAQGCQVISLDNNEKYQPDIPIDILKWEYWKEYKPGTFDVIMASPPCTEYSSAMTSRPRRMDKADLLVQKALEIIRYFQPTVWYLENPRGGRLKDRAFMQGIPYVDLDYCCFSDWGYQKLHQNLGKLGGKRRMTFI